MKFVEVFILRSSKSKALTFIAAGFLDNSKTTAIEIIKNKLL